MNRLSLCCAVFLVVLPISKSDKILAVLPLDIASHHRFSEPILRELAARGHQITVVTPISDPNPPPNYRQIIVPRIKIWDAVTPDDNSTTLSPNTNAFINSQMELRNRTLILTDVILRSKSMRDFLAEEDQKFDVIICELFHIQPFFMLSHIHKAPIVALSALGQGHFINQQMGNPYELSYNSHENLNLPSKYKFFDRLRNTFWTMVDLMERDMWNSEQDRLAKKYFGKKDEGDTENALPTLKELEKNVSLVLINTHFSIDTVRPNVPAIIEVGGLHITPSKKIAAPLQKFMDESSNGAVYINLESDILKSEISSSKTLMFSKLFNFHHKHRFVWQREAELSEKFDNVYVAKTLSQNDILGHKNVKVFVTHGGQLNIQDAVSKGVPVVCIPMYGDQFSSCNRVKDLGIGEVLNSESLCENSISDAIQRVLNVADYREKAQKLSGIFNDKPNPPLYTAVYWVEYVLKHKGANHMRSPALALHWYEYYLLDSIAFMGLTIYYAFWVLSWMFWNVVLRKKVPRDDIQHLIEKQKAQ